MALRRFLLKCNSSQGWIVGVCDDPVTNPDGIRVEMDAQYNAEGFTLSWAEWDTFVAQVEQLRQESK